MTRLASILMASVCAMLISTTFFAQTYWKLKTPQLASRWTSKVPATNKTDRVLLKKPAMATPQNNDAPEVREMFLQSIDNN